MLYGMANTDKSIYLRQLLAEVIILAPCVYLSEPIHESSQGLVPIAEPMYASYERNMDMYDQVGVYAYNGPDSEADKNKLCYIFGE